MAVSLHPAGRIAVIALALLLSDGIDVVAQAVPAQGTVSGCLAVAGQSAYRGVVALWPASQGKGPDPRLAIRPPLASRPVGTDGCFTLQAAPGEYFIGAIVRLTDGGWQGPPRPGDMVFLSPDQTGKNTVVTVRPGETVDIGRQTSGWVYAGFASTTPATTITGTLTGNDGKPLAGLLVFAFTDSTMSEEPLAVSEPSDSNGHYLLRLPEPATVYLRAREHYGRRSPADGGYMGVYGGEVATPVTVDVHGDKLARDLTVFRIPAAAARAQQKPARSPLKK